AVPVGAPASRPASWDYAGAAGPAEWARLNPEFATCGSGKRQSPIDIRDGIKVELEPVQFSYQPSTFRVIDTGHTVEVDVAPGNFIEVAGRRFELLQFHFHRPSEERIEGKPFDMVVHLLHRDTAGRLAVVAVLLERGSAQAIVQTVWNNLPLEKGEDVAARGTLDPGQLLPTERGYFTYMGSLTTPPCSEGVLWMVMKQPVPISAEQIAIFARLYPMNARPVQPAGERLVKESN
ncbi:MAG: carbonic anhydrase family protein, partial [Pseudomonadota bacterium]|nr:carbonic anhydrase family protein [Pseudomonadota bacterium]